MMDDERSLLESRLNVAIGYKAETKKWLEKALNELAEARANLKDYEGIKKERDRLRAELIAERTSNKHLVNSISRLSWSVAECVGQLTSKEYEVE